MLAAFIAAGGGIVAGHANGGAVGAAVFGNQTGAVGFVDQGYTGADAKAAAEEKGIDLIVVKVAEAKRGFVLLPKRWINDG